ncbi:MAG: glycosyltransferase family 2 protein [Bacillota bacterium]|nr:glycosyltransferase family 2 protein [Bacillota bacterium]
MKYSVIIPCYKSSHTIREVIELTMEEFRKLNIDDYEFVAVDDHSPDGGETIAELRALAEEYDQVTAIELAKNAGQHNALMAGLNHATGDIFISMDDDLQTHPSQLHLLIEELNKGYDIVYGYYPEKKHSVFRNLGSWFNHTSVRILIGKPKDMKTSSFWIIRRYVRDYVIQYRSQYTYIQGLFLRTTDNISSVPVQHFDRAYGTSGYTFKKLVSLWSNILGFSIVPLRIARNFGAVVAAIGIIGAIIVFIRKLLVPATAIGWSSMMFAIFFFSGMMMLFLGIIGEYLGRMFLSMSNNPQYVVKHVYHRTDHETDD